MKKLTFTFCIMYFAFCFQLANAQPWINLLPQDKSSEELTLKDYQQAFNSYWEPFNVDNGYIYTDGKKHKAGGWKQFKRWEYYMEGQVDDLETGVFPNKTGMQVVREHKKTNPEVYANNSKASNWSSLGPFNSTGGYAGIGRLNCIAFHPSDPNTWWVGAASGGLWKTTNNGGNTWECLTNDNGVLAVSDIIIPTDYVTSHTIYIATGDRDAGDNNSIGVLKSTDNGLTWNETGLTYAINQNRRVNRLLLDPNNNNNIVAATSAGVFKTTDGGDTWNGPLITQNFIDMEYKPGDFNTMYGSRGTGIWRTTDGGENWEQVATFGQQRAEIAVTPANPNIVYVVVSNNNSGLQGIYKSTDSGTNFEQTFSGSTLNLLGWSAYGNDGGGQGWYDLCIAASPTNADVVLVGGVNTWRSTNGGSNWQCINHWWGEAGVIPVHADKHALTYRNDGLLFEGNDGGVYTSPNDGTTWTDKTNGMQISQMYKLGCSATVSNEVITGLQDNGTKLFTNNNWHDVIGGDGMECVIDYTNVEIQYGCSQNGNFRRTTNRWGNTTTITPDGVSSGAWVTPFAIHPKTPNTIYVGYSELYKSTNRGSSWSKITSIASSALLKHIVICASNPDVIYIATDNRIWQTIDGGNNWTMVCYLTSGVITSLCIKNDEPNTLWHTRSSYNASRVFKSTNGGSTWENISTGLPQVPMYSIVYNKLEGQKEQLYVGSEVGVYFKDGDNDWVSFNNNLPNVRIGELEIYYDVKNPEACRLRAATYGRGLWESPIYIPTAPIAGTVMGNSQLCEYEATQLYLVSYAGEIQWQESSNGTTWSDIAGASSSFYQSTALASNKYYRAKVTLGTTVFSNPLLVEVSSKPETPIITRNNNTLISNAPTGNQWYNQDGLIPGAVNESFTPTENGNYFTIVTLVSCPSEPSNSILVNDLSIGGNAIRDGYFSLFPNPTNEQLIITNEELSINRVILVDISGKEVMNIQQNNVNEATINIAKIATGIYQVRIETDKGIFTSKVLKQ